MNLISTTRTRKIQTNSKVVLIMTTLLPIAIAPALSNGDYNGLFIGVGTGLNITQNYGLTKTYYVPATIPGQPQSIQSELMGNISGYSMPLFLNFGYRYNNYLATEFDYIYSGNQIYSKPQNAPQPSNFWGSQNTFGINLVGYLPIQDNWYLKGRIGLAFSMDTMTMYAGDPGSENYTSELGLGAQWFFARHWSLDFDYINFGLLASLHENYLAPPQGGPNLGTINHLMLNNFLFSINYHLGKS